MPVFFFFLEVKVILLHLVTPQLFLDIYTHMFIIIWLLGFPRVLKAQFRDTTLLFLSFFIRRRSFFYVCPQSRVIVFFFFLLLYQMYVLLLLLLLLFKCQCVLVDVFIQWLYFPDTFGYVIAPSQETPLEIRCAHFLSHTKRKKKIFIKI